MWEMMHQYQSALAALIFGLVTYLPPAVAQTAWPKFYAEIGAFDAQSPDDLKKMAASSLNIAVLGATISRSSAVQKYDIYYVDTYAQWLGWKACRPEAVALRTCTQVTQQMVINGFAKYLEKHYNDKNMIGYYILDDDPGVDVRPMLRGMHKLVEAANQKADFQRPTLCAFNDIRTLHNYDPAACDIVMIYLYSRNGQNGGAPIDWSLQDRLPPLLAALRAYGWNPNTSPLIGIPQTFSYPGQEYASPSKENVATQSEAYCRAGATALIAYAWHDGYVGDNATELYNTPSLVEGLHEGRNRCRQYWLTDSIH